MKPNPDMPTVAGLSRRRDNGRRSFAEPSNLMGQNYSQKDFIFVLLATAIKWQKSPTSQKHTTSNLQ